MNEQSIFQLAQRISREIDNANHGANLNDKAATDDATTVMHLRQEVARLNQRLAQIERRDNENGKDRQGVRDRENDTAAAFIHAPAAIGTGGTYVSAVHPSGQRFGIDEAITELVDYFETANKTCDLEPGNKPCDHCAMCSSRGF